MSYNKWPKRSAEKNYFLVPNEIFSLGLDYREISLYTYLLRCENRETYQCYPSYKTIGKAIGMCENTVAKYVRQLEEKGLIYTESTLVQSRDGKPLNGNLRYTIRPIQGAVEAFYERQFQQVEEDTARYRAAQLLEKSSAQSRQNALCAPFRAGRKILCKRFSTKSRMALESRADSGLNPLITESHGGQSGMRAGTA